MHASASTIRMMYTMASAFWARSVRAFYLLDVECQGKCPPDKARHGIRLLDAECQGKCPPDEAYHGIYLLDEECQGICHLDTTYILVQTQSVKKNFFQT